MKNRYECKYIPLNYCSWSVDQVKLDWGRSPGEEKSKEEEEEEESRWCRASSALLAPS